MHFNITKIKMCSVGLYSIFLRLNRYLKCSILMVSAGFAPWRILPHIDSSGDQVLQIYLSHTEKKRQYCAHDETRLVYFSFFIH